MRGLAAQFSALLELTSINGKVQDADRNPGCSEEPNRNVRIDDCIQIMQQEPAFIRPDPRLALEPVFEDGQRALPRAEFSEDTPQ